jgi:hypothetical protein
MSSTACRHRRSHSTVSDYPNAHHCDRGRGRTITGRGQVPDDAEEGAGDQGRDRARRLLLDGYLTNMPTLSLPPFSIRRHSQPP